MSAAPPQRGRGALAEAIASRTAAALASGALHPIETAASPLDADGARCVVRCLATTLARKEAASGWTRPEHRRVDPFDPPEPALVVADLPPTHVAVLNKYPVIEHHLLVVTRGFAPQEALLDPADCAALARCLAELGGLAFYNAGPVAGASQPHKHLQLVPLPLDDERAAGVPIEPLLAAAPPGPGPARVATLPFAHAFGWLAPAALDGPGAGARLHAQIRRSLAAIGVSGRPEGGVERQSAPYNLLVTKRWMLAVPRARADFEGIPINALGFAGSFVVRDAAQRERLARAGPLAALAAVAALPVFS